MFQILIHWIRHLSLERPLQMQMKNTRLIADERKDPYIEASKWPSLKIHCVTWANA
jgi:hypothetical protein